MREEKLGGGGPTGSQGCGESLGRTEGFTSRLSALSALSALPSSHPSDPLSALCLEASENDSSTIAPSLSLEPISSLQLPSVQSSESSPTAIDWSVSSDSITPPIESSSSSSSSDSPVSPVSRVFDDSINSLTLSVESSSITLITSVSPVSPVSRVFDDSLNSLTLSVESSPLMLITTISPDSPDSPISPISRVFDDSLSSLPLSVDPSSSDSPVSPVSPISLESSPQKGSHVFIAMAQWCALMRGCAANGFAGPSRQPSASSVSRGRERG